MVSGSVSGASFGFAREKEVAKRVANELRTRTFQGRGRLEKGLGELMGKTNDHLL